MSDINTATMLQVGTVLHETYRIESYLSSGGFGNTYIAKNIEFGETYAIKEFFVKGVCQRDGNSATISVSNTENSDSFAQQKEKFKKEARRLRSLSNPHIVKVYDLFEENGTAYYVMDYVDGENLSTRLNRTNSPLSESVVRNYLSQILDGLEAIHAAGIWHLDIKPANIMVDSHDVVKLIDFGASKQQSIAGGATASTGISYTNGYAPSEQMAQSYDKFGPWTDFYALGATLYKLLTNQNPPSFTDLSEDESEDKHIALPMFDVSNEMKKLVVWMMQVNRLKRPKNVGEIKDFLENSPGSLEGNNVATNKTSNVLHVDNEETVWFDNKADLLSKKTEQGKEKNEEKSNSFSSSNACLVVFLLIVVCTIAFFCTMAFFSRGCGNNVASGNFVAADSDSVVMDADTLSSYGNAPYTETPAEPTTNLNQIDYSSSKVTNIGVAYGETWKLVENSKDVLLVSETKKYSLSNIGWQGNEEHRLSSILAVKLYKGTIWFIAYDDSHSIGATGVMMGTQIFNYAVNNDVFSFVMNCNSAHFKGRTIQYCEAYIQQEGTSAADNTYGYSWQVLKL